MCSMPNYFRNNKHTPNANFVYPVHVRRRRRRCTSIYELPHTYWYIIENVMRTAHATKKTRRRYDDKSLKITQTCVESVYLYVCIKFVYVNTLFILPLLSLYICAMYSPKRSCFQSKFSLFVMFALLLCFSPFLKEHIAHLFVQARFNQLKNQNRQLKM